MVMSSIRAEQEGARVHADFPHVALNPGKLKGRKREVDFAQLLIEDNAQKGVASIFIETKWAGSTHASPSNIFEDFLRLAILKKVEPRSVCLFILAGFHSDVRKVLDAMPFESGQPRNHGIGSTGRQKRFVVDPSNLTLKGVLKAAVRDWIERGCDVPQSFVTWSGGLHPQHSEHGSMRFQCIAWEVESVSDPVLPANFWA